MKDASEGNRKAVLRCVELFNRGTLEWLDECYSRELRWVELPKPGTPRGQEGGYDEYRASAERILRFFPDRKLEVKGCVAAGDQVALQQKWRGTLATPLAGLAAGKVVEVGVASFFTLKDGLIVGQVDYCSA